MPDLLDRIRNDVNARLAELRPLVDEHGRLDAALRALSEGQGQGNGQTPGTARPSARRPRSGAAKTKRTRAKRAPRGANRQAVLRAAENRPGATSAELSTASGVERNTLNTLLARLVKNGELQTEVLPTGRTGYALTQASSWGSPPADRDTE